MRYLAVDYGQKRTGLALCDADETIASPLEVITGQKQLIKRIAEVIERERIEAIVLGLPLNMDDTEGPQAKNVRAFADKLKEHIEIDIFFHDERLSSFDAEKKLAGLEMTRKEKKRRVDAIAASAILQSFLDEKNSGK
jgi:putative Holliday junction resolvase